MAWRTELGLQAQIDKADLFDRRYEHRRANSGESITDAADAAEAFINHIESAIARLGNMPHVGTRHEHVLIGLRHVTIDRVILWFLVDDESRTVRVLGIFHGGQDHFGRMMRRLGAGGD